MSELTKMTIIYWIIIIGYVVVAMLTMAYTPAWAGIPLALLEWVAVAWYLFTLEKKENYND